MSGDIPAPYRGRMAKALGLQWYQLAPEAERWQVEMLEKLDQLDPADRKIVTELLERLAAHSKSYWR